MPRNIEIKARIESVASLLPKVVAISDSGPTKIEQDDTFFQCGSGRLKLRAFSPSSGELIFYRRPDELGPKESFYLIAPTSAPDQMREVLSCAYGEIGCVHKHRTLFLAGRTRIHLDKVEALGEFLELEVVLANDEPAGEGVRTAHHVLAELGIAANQLVEGAYLDLLLKSADQNRGQG